MQKSNPRINLTTACSSSSVVVTFFLGEKGSLFRSVFAPSPLNALSCPQSLSDKRLTAHKGGNDDRVFFFFFSSFANVGEAKGWSMHVVAQGHDGAFLSAIHSEADKRKKVKLPPCACLMITVVIPSKCVPRLCLNSSHGPSISLTNSCTYKNDLHRRRHGDTQVRDQRQP